jgi:peptide/nickel transport system substrate-binding protein
VPVSARDFVFTHAAVRSVWDELWEPDRPLHSVIRRVRAVDEKTVEVVLRVRFSGWRGLFPHVLPSHVLRGEDFSDVWRDRIHDAKTGRPIGSGPFLVTRWERGRAVTFTRNPRYWGPHPAYLDRLVVRFCAQCGALGSEQFESLRAGEIDLVQSSALSGAHVELLRGLPEVRVMVGQGASWEHLIVRVSGEGGNPALKRKHVRQALAYGIDRVALAREVNAQFTDRYPPSDSVLFLANSPYYRPNWQRYRYRPDEARRLLEGDGCRRGPDGIYACDARRLSLRMSTTAGNPRRQQTLELIQRQLRQVGIEIVPEYAAPPVLFNQILPSGRFDLGLLASLRSAETGRAVVVLGCGGAQNVGGYCQRILTRDLDQATRILDAAHQARVLNRADAQLAKDVPYLPLFQNPYVVAHRAAVRNVGLASQLNPFLGAEDWWLDR